VKYIIWTKIFVNPWLVPREKKKRLIIKIRERGWRNFHPTSCRTCNILFFAPTAFGLLPIIKVPEYEKTKFWNFFQDTELCESWHWAQCIKGHDSKACGFNKLFFQNNIGLEATLFHFLKTRPINDPFYSFVYYSCFTTYIKYTSNTILASFALLCFLQQVYNINN